jgi:hypothetical protein
MSFHVGPQGPATNELHRKEGLRSKSGICCSGFVDLRDTGMLQPAKCPRFLFKTAEKFGTCYAWFNHFQGYSTPGLLLLSLIDYAHTTFAEQLKNSILAYPNR